MFFSKQKAAYELRISDWSSDVCSSYREAGVAVFAGPETRWLGRKPVADALHLLEARGVEVAVVDNRLDGGPGRKVRFVLHDAPADRLLLIDDDGTVRGLAMRDREDGRWIGWMRGTGSTAGAPDIVVAVVSKANAMRSEEHTSELQSLMRISYAVLCLKKKK